MVLLRIETDEGNSTDRMWKCYGRCLEFTCTAEDFTEPLFGELLEFRIPVFCCYKWESVEYHDGPE